MASDVRPEFLILAKKKLRAKTQMRAKVYLECHRGRSEPAGLHGLRK